MNSTEELQAELRAANERLDLEKPDFHRVLREGRQALLRRATLMTAGALALSAALIVGALAARAAVHDDRQPDPHRPTAMTSEAEPNSVGKPDSSTRPGLTGAAAAKPDLVVALDETGAVTVRNVGQAGSGPFVMTLSNTSGDGERFGRTVVFPLSGLGPGESQTKTFPCSRTLVAVVDARMAIDETDEDNNRGVVDCRQKRPETTTPTTTEKSRRSPAK